MPLSPVAKAVRKRIRSCQRCDLRKSCIAPVPWSGSVPLPPPGILIVGEAPGKEEDEQGRGFVGRSGQVLRTMLRQARIDEAQCGYANTVACRPPGNRDPSMSEVLACSGNLKATISILQPAYLLLVGSFALHRFRPKAQLQHAAGRPIYVGDKGPSRLLGGGLLAMAIYHPAALLHPTKDRPKLEARMKRDLDAFSRMVYDKSWEWPDDCEACDLPVEFYDGQGTAFCSRHYPKLKVDQEVLFK